MQRTLTVLAAAVLLASASHASAKKPVVYSWKTVSGSTAYSDTPYHLRLNNTNTVNIRTQTVRAKSARPVVPESLADQQAMLSQQIAIRNRHVEEQNAKIAAEMQKAKQENCQTAQSNRTLAESARNRDQLIQKYDADIKRYCN